MTIKAHEKNDSIEMTQLRKAIADGPDALKRYHQNRAKEQTGNGIVDKESMSFKTRNTLRQMFYESLESAGDKVIENPVNNLMNNKDFINKWKKARNDVHAQYDQQQKDRTAVLALRQLIYGTCVTRATIPTAKK